MSATNRRMSDVHSLRPGNNHEVDKKRHSKSRRKTIMADRMSHSTKQHSPMQGNGENNGTNQNQVGEDLTLNSQMSASLKPTKNNILTPSKHNRSTRQTDAGLRFRQMMQPTPLRNLPVSASKKHHMTSSFTRRVNYDSSQTRTGNNKLDTSYLTNSSDSSSGDVDDADSLNSSIEQHIAELKLTLDDSRTSDSGSEVANDFAATTPAASVRSSKEGGQSHSASSSSSSSGSSSGLMNQSVLSDTTELTASNFVLTANSKQCLLEVAHDERKRKAKEAKAKQKEQRMETEEHREQKRSTTDSDQGTKKDDEYQLRLENRPTPGNSPRTYPGQEEEKEQAADERNSRHNEFHIRNEQEQDRNSKGFTSFSANGHTSHQQATGKVVQESSTVSSQASACQKQKEDDITVTNNLSAFGANKSLVGPSPSNLMSRVQVSPKSLRKFTASLKRDRFKRQLQREQLNMRKLSMGSARKPQQAPPLPFSRYSLESVADVDRGGSGRQSLGNATGAKSGIILDDDRSEGEGPKLSPWNMSSKLAQSLYGSVPDSENNVGKKIQNNAHLPTSPSSSPEDFAGKSQFYDNEDTAEISFEFGKWMRDPLNAPPTMNESASSIRNSRSAVALRRLSKNQNSEEEVFGQLTASSVLDQERGAVEREVGNGKEDESTLTEHSQHRTRRIGSPRSTHSTTSRKDDEKDASPRSFDKNYNGMETGDNTPEHKADMDDKLTSNDNSASSGSASSSSDSQVKARDDEQLSLSVDSSPGNGSTNKNNKRKSPPREISVALSSQDTPQGRTPDIDNDVSRLQNLHSSSTTPDQDRHTMLQRHTPNSASRLTPTRLTKRPRRIPNPDSLLSPAHNTRSSCKKRAAHGIQQPLQTNRVLNLATTSPARREGSDQGRHQHGSHQESSMHSTEVAGANSDGDSPKTCSGSSTSSHSDRSSITATPGELGELFGDLRNEHSSDEESDNTNSRNRRRETASFTDLQELLNFDTEDDSMQSARMSGVTRRSRRGRRSSMFRSSLASLPERASIAASSDDHMTEALRQAPSSGSPEESTDEAEESNVLSSPESNKTKRNLQSPSFPTQNSPEKLQTASDMSRTRNTHDSDIQLQFYDDTGDPFSENEASQVEESTKIDQGQKTRENAITNANLNSSRESSGRKSDASSTAELRSLLEGLSTSTDSDPSGNDETPADASPVHEQHTINTSGRSNQATDDQNAQPPESTDTTGQSRYSLNNSSSSGEPEDTSSVLGKAAAHKTQNTHEMSSELVKKLLAVDSSATDMSANNNDDNIPSLSDVISLFGAQSESHDSTTRNENISIATGGSHNDDDNTVSLSEINSLFDSRDSGIHSANDSSGAGKAGQRKEAKRCRSPNDDEADEHKMPPPASSESKDEKACKRLKFSTEDREAQERDCSPKASYHSEDGAETASSGGIQKILQQDSSPTAVLSPEGKSDPTTPTALSLSSEPSHQIDNHTEEYEEREHEKVVSSAPTFPDDAHRGGTCGILSSALKKPGDKNKPRIQSAKKTVNFKSPQAAEYNIGSCSSNLTPMPKNEAKNRYRLPQMDESFDSSMNESHDMSISSSPDNYLLTSPASETPLLHQRLPNLPNDNEEKTVTLEVDMNQLMDKFGRSVDPAVDQNNMQEEKCSSSFDSDSSTSVLAAGEHQEEGEEMTVELEPNVHGLLATAASSQSVQSPEESGNAGEQQELSQGEPGNDRSIDASAPSMHALSPDSRNLQPVAGLDSGHEHSFASLDTSHSSSGSSSSKQGKENEDDQTMELEYNMATFLGAVDSRQSEENYPELELNQLDVSAIPSSSPSENGSPGWRQSESLDSSTSSIDANKKEFAISPGSAFDKYHKDSTIPLERNVQEVLAATLPQGSDENSRDDASSYQNQSYTTATATLEDDIAIVLAPKFEKKASGIVVEYDAAREEDTAGSRTGLGSRRSSISSHTLDLAAEGSFSVSRDGCVSILRPSEDTDTAISIFKVLEPSSERNENEENRAEEEFNLTCHELLEFAGLCNIEGSQQRDVLFDFAMQTHISTITDDFGGVVVGVCGQFEGDIDEKPDIQEEYEELIVEDSELFLHIQSLVRNAPGNREVKEQLKSLANQVRASTFHSSAKWSKEVFESWGVTHLDETFVKPLQTDLHQIEIKLHQIDEARGIMSSMVDAAARRARRKSMYRRKAAASDLERQIRDLQREIQSATTDLENTRLRDNRADEKYFALTSQKAKREEIAGSRPLAESSLAKFTMLQGINRWETVRLTASVMSFRFGGCFPQSSVSLAFDIPKEGTNIYCRAKIDPSLYRPRAGERQKISSTASSVLQRKVAETLTRLSGSPLQSAGDIGPWLLTLDWQFGRLEQLAIELSALESRHQCNLLFENGKTSFEIEVNEFLTVTFELSAAYPTGPMKIQIDVLEGKAADIPGLRRQLIKLVKPGHHYLTRLVDGIEGHLQSIE